MSPIEIFIDRKRVAESSSGPCELRLPDPPGGSVNWFGDGAGAGKIVVGEEKEEKMFELKNIGEIATFQAPKDLSSSLFPFAESSEKVSIEIRRK